MTNRNNGPPPTMVVVYRRIITKLLMKVVDMDFVDLEEVKGGA